MSKIRFEPGDTLGGTAPIILLRQIEGNKVGRRRRRNLSLSRRKRARWPYYTVVLVAGAAAVYAVLDRLVA